MLHPCHLCQIIQANLKKIPTEVDWQCSRCMVASFQPSYPYKEVDNWSCDMIAWWRCLNAPDYYQTHCPLAWEIHTILNAWVIMLKDFGHGIRTNYFPLCDPCSLVLHKLLINDQRSAVVWIGHTSRVKQQHLVQQTTFCLAIKYARHWPQYHPVHDLGNQPDKVQQVVVQSKQSPSIIKNKWLLFNPTLNMRYTLIFYISIYLFAFIHSFSQSVSQSVSQ